LGGNYTAEVLASYRKTACWPDKNTLQRILGGAKWQAGGMANITVEKSDYFRLTTRVTLGTTEFTLYSLLKRTGGKTTPLLRSFGTS